MRGRAGRGRKSGPSTVTIPVQATAAGIVAANAFTGWTHSAGTITNRTAYGVTANYFNLGSSTTVDLQSKAVSRDHEVEFWAYSHRAYIRIADGKAFRAQVGAGAWVIEFVSIGSSGYGSDTVIANLGSGTITGFNGSDTDGDTYVFGVEGFEVYLKWNGTEQFRKKQIFHNMPGRVGFRHEIDSPFSGLRSASATFKASVALYSSPEFDILDVRDFGVKDVSTTGSMTGGSATLTVASNPGFAIGDPVIVEIGGESGAGARGTRGVGGQWPTLTYANATAMNADTSQVTNKVCGLLDTGATYKWNGSAWVTLDTNNSYYEFLVPKSLLATIINISGTTFTLDTAATVSTTNANVYLNAEVRYREVLGAQYYQLDSYVSDKVIEFPAGNFAWGLITPSDNDGFGNSRVRWTVRGQGMDNTQIFSPEGTYTLALHSQLWYGPCYIHDMELMSNCRADGGYLLNYDAATDNPTQDGGRNLRMSLAENVHYYNIRTVDHDLCALEFSYSTDCTMYDCIAIHTTGHRSYRQWTFELANCTNSVGHDLELDCDYMIPGPEIFQSTGCSYYNMTIRNAFWSLNSADGWEVRDTVTTIEENSATADWVTWTQSNQAIVLIGSNIDNSQGNPGTSDGGLFIDFEINFGGFIAPGVTPSAFNLSGNVENITIQGQYPDKPNSKGLITIPNYNIPFASGVRDDDTNRIGTIVDGVRVTVANSGGADISVLGTTGIVRNCVADTISCNGTTSSNITNAEYEALP